MYFASFRLVSLTSGKSVKGILNSVLRYSNTLSRPFSSSFFFPGELNSDQWSLTTLRHSLSYLPSQRSASVSSDRRQVLHAPDKTQFRLHRVGLALHYDNTAKSEMNLCRPSPLDQVIHFPHCGKPRQPLKVAEEITLKRKTQSTGKLKVFLLTPVQLQTILCWQHIAAVGSRNFQHTPD